MLFKSSGLQWTIEGVLKQQWECIKFVPDCIIRYLRERAFKSATTARSLASFSILIELVKQYSLLDVSTRMGYQVYHLAFTGAPISQHGLDYLAIKCLKDSSEDSAKYLPRTFNLVSMSDILLALFNSYWMGGT